jgi:hypothetical protein
MDLHGCAQFVVLSGFLWVRIHDGVRVSGFVGLLYQIWTAALSRLVLEVILPDEASFYLLSLSYHSFLALSPVALVNAIDSPRYWSK